LILKNKMLHKFFELSFVILFLLLSILFLNPFFSAAPYGASLSPLNNQTAPTGNSQSVSAIAGNVTEMDISGFSTTQSWQGYYGNVSGVIQLSDATSKVLYNWSLTAAQGEVYASLNSSVSWNNIQCFNLTADGTYNDDSSNRGGTSQHGINLTQLESIYNINSSDVDGINETFSFRNHAMFYTNNQQFSAGECWNTKIFNSSGAGLYDEVLLYSPDTRGVVYTSILRDNSDGFDSKTHDFEMLVPENGHGTDTSVTPYYFYLELQ
jgi:hypothetical protein